LNFKEYPSKVEEEKGGFEQADASAKFWLFRIEMIFASTTFIKASIVQFKPFLYKLSVPKNISPME
jgi:hypothetical protein